MAGQRPRADGARAAPLVEARTPRRTRSTASSWWRWPGSSSRSWASSRRTPPRSTRGRCCRWPSLARTFAQLPERQQAVFVQLMTMSAADFLDQWFETDPLKATMSASGIIGTYQGIRSPGHGLRAAPPLHGRDRRRVPGLGHPQGRHRRRVVRDRPRGRRPSAPRSGPRRPSPGSPSAAAGRPAWCSRAARRSRRSSVLSSADAKVTFLDLLEAGTLDPEFEQEVRRFKFRGSSGKVNLAVDRLPDFTLPARRRRAPPGRDQLQPLDGRHGAGLRRREVRPLEPQARTST